jgi:hypothetical protein
MKVIYPSNKTVSIWIGTFSSESDFDLTVETAVVPVLGLPVAIESTCEISFESEPVAIHALLGGFSGWETFIEAAKASASVCGIQKANAALVCYYISCIDAPANWQTLKFLGSFSGSDNDG